MFLGRVVFYGTTSLTHPFWNQALCSDADSWDLQQRWRGRFGRWACSKISKNWRKKWNPIWVIIVVYALSSILIQIIHNNPMNDMTIFRTKCQFCRFPPVCDKPAEAVNQTRSGTYHINEIKRFHQIKWTEEKTQKMGHRFADKLCHQMEPQFHSTTISCHVTGPPCCLQYPQMPNADSAGPGPKHEDWWSWFFSPVGVENMRKHVWMCSETFWNPGSFWRIWWHLMTYQHFITVQHDPFESPTSSWPAAGIAAALPPCAPNVRPELSESGASKKGSFWLINAFRVL